MQTRLLELPKIVTELGEFDVEPWNGINESGYVPEGERVLLLPDQAAARTAGGIMLPEDLRERVSMASETGVLVAIGPEAFKWNADRTRRREIDPPEAGTRVFFERYSGGILHGKDGRIYRVADDKTIGAIEIPAPRAAADQAA